VKTTKTESLWAILFETFAMFAKMVIVLFAFFCMLQLITGTPPENVTPMDYPMADN